MGCLGEFFFELFAEGLFELISYCYFKLMQMIVPSRTFTEKTTKTMKKIAAVLAAVLLFAVIIGITLLTDTDPQISTVGKYITYISMAVIVAQLILGIVLKLRKRR